MHDFAPDSLRLLPAAYSEGELFFLLWVASIAGSARGFSGLGAMLIVSH